MRIAQAGIRSRLARLTAISIHKKLVVAFLICTVVLSAATLTTVHFVASEKIEREVHSRLVCVVQSRAAHIETFLAEHREATATLAGSASLKLLLQSGNDDPDYSQAYMAAEYELLNIVDAQEEFFKASLVDRDGTVVVSTDPSALDTEEAEVAAVLASEGVYTMDLHISKGFDIPCMDYGLPVFDDVGRMLGGVIVDVDLTGLYDVTMNRTGLGDTGEVYLVNREGLMISPSRFLDDVVLKQRVDTLHFRRALNLEGHEDGQLEHSETIVSGDYRGIDVLGAHAVIPEMQWALIAEMDISEALQPVSSMRNVLLIVAAVVCVAGVAFSFLASRSISKPISQLKAAATEMARGNLTTRVEASSRDEVGELAAAFNMMGRNLQEAQDDLEHRVCQRTEELQGEVSRRKQIEQALREKEQQLHNLLSNVDAIVLEGDPFKIYYVGGHVEKMLGYPRELWFQHPEGPSGFWQERLHPDDKDKFEACANAIARGEDHSFEYRMIAADGREVWFYDAVTVETRDDKPVKSRSVMVDITERKLMEESVRESERRYRLLAENVQDVICSFGMDLKPTYMSPSITSLLGFTVEEAMARTYEESITPASRDVAIASMAGNLALDRENHGDSPRPQATELEFYRKDGSTVWVEASSSFLRDSNGEPIGIVSLLRDLTERKKAEAERQRIDQQLQLSGRLAAVGQLSAGIAHELNNPLTAVQAYAEFLVTRADLDESVREDVQTIYNEARRATRITSNLLTFARGHKIDRCLVSVNEIVVDSVELHAYRMKVNNIELVTELEQDLPRVMADYHQIQQVFVNILANAEQAMIEEHGKGRLLVRTWRARDRVLISFADDGPGISQENLKSIFDPFFTTKEVGKGTGLGLSICYGIVEEHGGHMYAESKPGEGSTLMVEIPFVHGDDPGAGEPDLIQRPEATGRPA